MFTLLLPFLFANSDVTKIQNGIGDKVAMVIQSVTMFLTGFIIGFAYSWKLTLVILSLTPALVVTGAITGKVRFVNRFLSYHQYRIGLKS